jgi:hexosaminidase
MLFPRVCAIAEVVWSSRERDFADFEGRLRDHLLRLDALAVNYRPLEGPTPGQRSTWESR